MEATPPDEPIKPKPPVARPRKSAQRVPVAAAPVEPVEPVVEPALNGELENELASTRVLGAFALGLVALLLICVIAFLVAYRNIPEGL